MHDSPVANSISPGLCHGWREFLRRGIGGAEGRRRGHGRQKDGSSFDTGLKWYSSSVHPGGGWTIATNDWIIPGIGRVLRLKRSMDVDHHFVDQLPLLMEGKDAGVVVKMSGWDALNTLIVPSRKLLWARSVGSDYYALRNVP